MNAWWAVLIIPLLPVAVLAVGWLVMPRFKALSGWRIYIFDSLGSLLISAIPAYSISKHFGATNENAITMACFLWMLGMLACSVARQSRKKNLP